MKRGAIALIAALLSVALTAIAYCIRLGTYRAPAIDPQMAAIVAAFTGLGIAFVCIKCVLPEDETAE